jgi:hypothetical protein
MYEEDAPRNLRMPMSCVHSDTAAYLPFVTIRKLTPNTNHSNIDTYPPTRVRTTLGCRSSPYPIPTRSTSL